MSAIYFSFFRGFIFYFKSTLYVETSTSILTLTIEGMTIVNQPGHATKYHFW